MPNYRYNTSDYMCRSNCSSPSHRMPDVAVTHQNAQRTACCDDRADYDALSGLPLAMAYVPWQEWCAIYEVKRGFDRGTIFEELDKPFKGIGGCC